MNASRHPRRLYGGVEAGGSKWVCGVGTGLEDLRAEEIVPTTTPEETIDRVASFFERHGPVAALGIGCFGPVDLDPSSPGWGSITTTPKPGWARTAVAPTLRERLSVPVAFDTDVNVAALAEHRWGAAREVDTLCYVTVGTGIGGGVLVDGRPLHGLVHPEIGHLRVDHDRGADPFDGACPFHGDCWEGLASGRALEARWRMPAAELDDEAAWKLEATYLARGLVSVIYVLSPQRIVLGGGVMRRPGLLPLVREEISRLVNGYLDAPALDRGIADFVVSPGLGARAGMLGAIALAQSG